MGEREIEIRRIAFDQVQQIIACAVEMNLDIATLSFIELAVLGLKAEDLARKHK